MLTCPRSKARAVRARRGAGPMVRGRAGRPLLSPDAGADALLRHLLGLLDLANRFALSFRVTAK